MLLLTLPDSFVELIAMILQFITGLPILALIVILTNSSTPPHLLAKHALLTVPLVSSILKLEHHSVPVAGLTLYLTMIGLYVDPSAIAAPSLIGQLIVADNAQAELSLMVPNNVSHVLMVALLAHAQLKQVLLNVQHAKVASYLTLPETCADRFVTLPKFIVGILHHV